MIPILISSKLGMRSKRALIPSPISEKNFITLSIIWKSPLIKLPNVSANEKLSNTSAPPLNPSFPNTQEIPPLIIS